MFCPDCGAEIKIKLERSSKYLPPSAEIVCPECGKAIFVEDRSSIDQEGTVEVVFH